MTIGDQIFIIDADKLNDEPLESTITKVGKKHFEVAKFPGKRWDNVTRQMLEWSSIRYLALSDLLQVEELRLRHELARSLQRFFAYSKVNMLTTNELKQIHQIIEKYQ